MSDFINIKEAEKLYPDEWLLFDVVECDEMYCPVEGRLLAHSKSRKEIHQVATKVKPKYGFTTYTGEPVPEGHEIIL